MGQLFGNKILETIESFRPQRVEAVYKERYEAYHEDVQRRVGNIKVQKTVNVSLVVLEIALLMVIFMTIWPLFQEMLPPKKEGILALVLIPITAILTMVFRELNQKIIESINLSRLDPLFGRKFRETAESFSQKKDKNQLEKEPKNE